MNRLDSLITLALALALIVFTAPAAGVEATLTYLTGMVWCENIGWINFETGSLGNDRAGFDACTHRFYGYAWRENVGWINLNDATTFVAVGPCAFGDFNCDGDVALDDYGVFQSMLGGPNVPVYCPAFDADEDGDIDLLDFAEFQAAF